MKTQISSEIEQRQRQIQQDTSDCIREIYHPESYQSMIFESYKNSDDEST